MESPNRRSLRCKWRGWLVSHEHPLLCYRHIFEDTEVGLQDVSRRVIKLFRFVGGVLEEQYDDDQSEGKRTRVETKSKRTELIEMRGTVAAT